MNYLIIDTTDEDYCIVNDAKLKWSHWRTVNANDAIQWHPTSINWKKSVEEDPTLAVIPIKSLPHRFSDIPIKQYKEKYPELFI